MIQKLLIRLTLFLLPVLLLLAGLEYVQRQLPNNYTHKRQRFEAGADRWETLILGSSHSYLGVDPAQFEGPSFNLAFTAQTLCFDRFLLEKYIDQLPALKRVILPISYASLGAESYLNPGIYDKTYYYAQFYDSPHFADWWKVERYSRVGLFSVKRSVDRTRSYYTQGDSLLECRRDGFYGLVFSRDLETNGKESGFFHDQFYHEEVQRANLSYLDRMADLCAARGVSLYLISTPMWPSYMQHVDRSRYTHMVTTIDSFAQAQGLPYWNFTEAHGLAAEDFYDSNHLSASGAERFTQRLKDSIAVQEGLLLAETSEERE